VLRILTVAYPLAALGPDAVGGAEQIATHLERGFVERGDQSIVVASERSHVAGTLVPVPRKRAVFDQSAIAEARENHRRAIRFALDRWSVDLIHLHGVDFGTYLPPPGVPVLVTLHCPASWYGDGALEPRRPDTWFNAVSPTQHAGLLPNPRLLRPVENGVPRALFAARHAKRRYALVLGRVAPEKGIHLALEAARSADYSLLIAGEVYPYPEHQRYFAREIEPRLDRERRYIGAVDFARTRRLLAAARCLLLPSLVPETSSMVAREALAAGTPVIAFQNGALPEIIDHGRTGFLVADVRAMAEAIGTAGRIDPGECRAMAIERFSLARMIEGYLDLYREILAGRGRAHLGASSG
jgi:hypothetical protein